MQPHGSPCWIDLETDIERARDFYSQLFGWTWTDVEGAPGWVIAHVEGLGPVASMGPGTPRNWQVFLRADDVDATVARAEELGGTIDLAPGDVGPMGRMARIADPGGAKVALWQAGTLTGLGEKMGRGGPVWVEVNTWQGEAVRDFFAALFDLEQKKMEGMAYWTLNAESRPRYGVLQMTDEWKGMDPSWSTYFGVEDTDAAAAKLKELGGTVLYGPFDTPQGRIAVCRDPMGTAVHLVSVS